MRTVQGRIAVLARLVIGALPPESNNRQAARSTVTLLSALLITGGAVPATAASPTISYTLTAGFDKITFSLPQMPTPAPCENPNGFCVSSVAITINGNTISDGTVGFFTPANGGGLTIREGGTGGTLLVNQGGPGYIQGVPNTGEQLFTGTLGAPTLETFSNLQLVAATYSNPQYNESFLLTATGPPSPPPSITPGGIVPVDSTVATIQAGEWVSIFGTNLASATATWNGDFPISLGGTSVTINGKAAYLSYVSPTQINVQSPDDSSTGSVPVAVTTAGLTATSTVTLARFAPSFLLLDSKHVAGIILRSNGSGAYGDGTYDILGPTGISLGYPTVSAKAGDTIALFALGLGPTSQTVPSGQAFSGATPTTYPVTLLVNNVTLAPIFSGLSGAGLYQINFTVPPGLGTGDVPLVAIVATAGGAQTPPNVVISLQ